MLKDLVLLNRSYRRFHEDTHPSRQTLLELVDLARCTASGGNQQPLKYMGSCHPATNARIFRSLGWAGYLNDWPGPADGERPGAYVVILHDLGLSTTAGCDHGIAAQTILLGAVERGLGGCIIGSINRDALRLALSVPKRFDILVVIALGKPAEKVVLDEVGPDGSIKYWREPNGTHHVPKRPLEDIVVAIPE